MRLSRKSFLPILIASGLILVAASNGKAQPSAAPPSKPPAVQSHKPTAGDRGDAGEGRPPQTLKSPFEAELLEALRAIARQQQTVRREDQAKEKRWWPPSPSWAIVYVTVIYVVATVIYVAVAIFTLRAVKRQADIAEEIPSIIEAPHISVGMIAHIVEHGGVGGVPSGAPHIEYWFKNHGRTLAQITEICTLFEMHAVGALPEKPVYKPSRINPFHDRFVVPPNSETTHARCSGGFSFHSEADFAPIRDSRATCIFYGYVKFRSIFPRRPPRIYGFGHFYDPAYNSLNPIGGTEYNYDREER
ncbi:hypothetical protein [Candidatus Binatus sp.]|uniref:hypothetical protein n=1 Tax=Candidatus Binatus sp. TaxID=2811406 RepID=UPI002F92FB73